MYLISFYYDPTTDPSYMQIGMYSYRIKAYKSLFEVYELSYVMAVNTKEHIFAEFQISCFYNQSDKLGSNNQ